MMRNSQFSSTCWIMWKENSLQNRYFECRYIRQGNHCKSFVLLSEDACNSKEYPRYRERWHFQLTDNFTKVMVIVLTSSVGLHGRLQLRRTWTRLLWTGYGKGDCSEEIKSTYKSRLPLVRIQDTITAERYVDTALWSVAPPYFH